MGVSSIVSNEVVEGRDESLLIVVICEIKSLEIVDKDVTGGIMNAGNISALVECTRGPKSFSGCVGDHSSGASRSFIGPHSGEMIALDPKGEIPLSLNHLIICDLIVIEPLCILDVAPDITAAVSYNDVHQV